MRKSIITGAMICCLAATSAYAGTLADPLVESEVATTEESRSSGWIIPVLILVAVIAVVASSDSGGGGKQCDGPCYDE